MSVFAGALDGGEFCEATRPAQAAETKPISDRNMLIGTGKTIRGLAKCSSRPYTPPLLMQDM
jgi:hypothetical protein